MFLDLREAYIAISNIIDFENYKGVTRHETFYFAFQWNYISFLCKKGLLLQGY